MSINALLNIGHTGIANLNSVSVEDFLQKMFFEKFFIKDFEERLADVCRKNFYCTVGCTRSQSIRKLSLLLTSTNGEIQLLF